MAFPFLSASRLARFPKLVAAVRFGVPTALVLALSLACLGSGERITTGMCPPTETCSSALPGLSFQGNSPVEHLLIATALGGVQRVSFSSPWLLDGGRTPLPDFEVSSTPPRVQILGTARGMDGEGEATLRGVATGDTFLRVTEAGTGLLLDRLSIRVADVAFADLLAVECLDVPPAPEVGEPEALGAHGFRCGAVWSGSRVRAAFVLGDATGADLWDDSMTHDGIAPTAVSSWPTGLVVDVVAPTAGTLRFEMRGDSGAHVVELPVASDVADVLLDGSGRTTLALRIGVPTTLCAAGVFAIADGSRGAVLGAPANFVGDGVGLTIAAPPASDDVFNGAPTNCRSVTLAESAPHTLTVTIGSVSKAYAVTPMLSGTTALARRQSTSSARLAAMRAATREPRLGERLGP